MFHTRLMELVHNLELYDRGHYKEKIIAPLMVEFNISERTVHKRIKSYTGKTVTDFVREKRTPTKEQVDKALIVTDSSQEFFCFLGIERSQCIKIGIFDRMYGVSTYAAAKAKLYGRIPHLSYNPTSDDNKTLIISQVLGDGYLCPQRGALQIAHCMEQFDYLRMKVSLFNRAFPATAGLENIKVLTHAQGHKYCRWYSKKLTDKYVKSILSKRPHELVPEMTPIGWMLLFLDDGYLGVNQQQSRVVSIAFSQKYPELGEAYKRKLQKYGFTFQLRENKVQITSLEDVTRFLQCFIWPYKHLIPECMYYKLDLKI